MGGPKKQRRNHEGFQTQSSTINADAHLLRLFLAAHADPENVLASFDVSNAFLNAEMSDNVMILTQPAPELIQVGLVKPSTLYLDIFETPVTVTPQQEISKTLNSSKLP